MFLRVSRPYVIAAFILISLFCQAAQSTAAKLPRGPIPSWVVPLPVNLTTKVKAKDVSGGYHVLLKDSQSDLPSQTQFYHNGYLVFTDEGLQSVSEIQVTYDPKYEQIVFHAIRIWRNGKPIDKLATVKFKQSQVEKELDKHIYNEQLSAIALLDDVRINDIVEFAYSIKGWNPVFENKFFNNFNLRYSDPVDEIYVRVNTTPNRKINYKLFNTKEQPAQSITSNQQSYTWHLKNVPGFPVDSDIPSWYDPYPWVSLSEFTNWQEFGQWAAALYEVKGLSKELQQEIDSIKNISGDAGERISATVRFVQDKIRYLGLENGISGYKPHAPAQTFKQRFGDCKDKSFLLSQMLQAMNINAYPALVNTYYQHQIPKWLPSAYAFNHCIVVVELPGKKIWIDPTISLQRGRYDSLATPSYKTAMVLKNGGGAFVRMETPQASKMKVAENFIFNDIGGAVTLEVKTYYYGAEADGMRQRLATSNLKETEKSYLNFYASTYPNISVARDLDFIDDPEKNIITTLEEYTIQDLWSPAQKNKDSVLTAYFYPQVLRDRLGKPSTVIRKMPISLSYPSEFEETITLLLPESWPIDEDTKVIQDKSFRFKSDVSYQQASNSIILKYTYKNLRDYVPGTEASTYLKKQKEVLDQLGFEIYNPLNTTKTTPERPVDILMIVLAIIFLSAWAYGTWRAYHYDPIIPETFSYKQDIGGWLVLVLLGLYLTPLSIVIRLITNNFFEASIWQLLTNKSYEGFNPVQALLILFEFAGNIGFLVFAVLLIILFHERRTSVPRLLIAFYGCNFLFIFFDNALAVMLKVGESDFKLIFRTLIAAAIWIPYFIKSKRVKRTFTTTLYQPEEVNLFEKEGQEAFKTLVNV
ncbi:hypothetical protein AHMF7605_19825 [Adhaeribacter arboris]|uniref:DUF3857 domain-containing protein n=1 Tax=Adhaeribacter arboris TaxID=2072846 RepID=A0A2T2YJE2_9BACT|nr:DUF3857 domain-containing protein [Adhaeribacter arboris]PSR55595.1 hypothetical protein AHMF7605_19825 [Adhaeribacter arboris]